MLRSILAVIVGFVVWSVLWVGSDAVLSAVSADYAEGLKNFSTSILLIGIVRSVIISIIAGYVTAFIAGNQAKVLAVFALGVLLLVFGILVQASVWNQIPIWYHLVFLALLIPMSLLGGRFRTA